ncbi:hypothetical protein AB4Z54_01410 [Streptomyces sp. MCAF7]
MIPAASASRAVCPTTWSTTSERSTGARGDERGGGGGVQPVAFVLHPLLRRLVGEDIAVPGDHPILGRARGGAFGLHVACVDLQTAAGELLVEQRVRDAQQHHAGREEQPSVDQGEPGPQADPA